MIQMFLLGVIVGIVAMLGAFKLDEFENRLMRRWDSAHREGREVVNEFGGADLPPGPTSTAEEPLGSRQARHPFFDHSTAHVSTSSSPQGEKSEGQDPAGSAPHLTLVYDQEGRTQE